MSPEICQDPAAQLRHWGLQGTKGPTELRERGGAHTAPHQTETGLLLLQPPQGQRSQLMPEEEHQQGRATAGPSHAESTPSREEAGAHPFLPGKPAGDTPASAACHLAVRLPVALGSRHSEPQLPRVPVTGPGRAALCGARGPSSNRPLLPGPSSHACPWSHGAPAK